MIKIICTGKLNQDYQRLYSFYQKQLDLKIDLIEIPEKKYSTKDLIKHLKQNAYVICLDEKGTTLTSHDFSEMIDNYLTQGLKLIFIIGGAEGLDESIRQKADMLLSFGKQTWPHQMVRVMLMEQIYRSEKMRHGHPYHKA